MGVLFIPDGRETVQIAKRSIYLFIFSEVFFFLKICFFVVELKYTGSYLHTSHALTIRCLNDFNNS